MGSPLPHGSFARLLCSDATFSAFYSPSLPIFLCPPWFDEALPTGLQFLSSLLVYLVYTIQSSWNTHLESDALIYSPPQILRQPWAFPPFPAHHILPLGHPSQNPNLRPQFDRPSHKAKTHQLSPVRTILIFTSPSPNPSDIPRTNQYRFFKSLFMDQSRHALPGPVSLQAQRWTTQNQLGIATASGKEISPEVVSAPYFKFIATGLMADPTTEASRLEALCKSLGNLWSEDDVIDVT